MTGTDNLGRNKGRGLCVALLVFLCLQMLLAMTGLAADAGIKSLIDQATSARDKAPAQAIEFAKEALEQSSDTLDTALRVKLFSIIARAHGRLGNYHQALDYGTKATDLAKTHQIYGPYYADAEDALGTAQLRLGHIDVAFLSFQKALEVRKELGLEGEIVNSLTNIASLNGLAGQFDRALEYFDRAEEKARRQELSTALNRILINKGLSLIEAGHPEKALPILAEARHMAIAEDNTLFLAHSYLITGAALVNLGRHDEAEPYLLQSQELAQKLSVKTALADSFHYLADISLARKNTEDARKLAEQFFHIAEEAKDNARLRDAHLLLSKIDKAENRTETALQHLEDHLKLKDETFNRESARRLSLLQAEFGITEKEHEIALLVRDQKIQALQLAKEQSLRHITAIGFGILVLIVSALAILLRSNVVARRATTAKAVELIRTKNELSRANRAKSDLLATTSHEVRTPLNGILGMTQILMASDLTEEQNKQVSAIYQAGNALLTILNDLLDIAKIEAGRVELKPRDFSIRTLADGYRDLWEPNARKKGLTFDITVDSLVPETIFGDPNRIQQILFNLIANSIKFTEQGSVTVRISAVRHPDSTQKNRIVFLHFDITDTGPGIPEDLKTCLFEQYNHGRLGGSGDKRGTGLGLHICRQLTQRLDGTIGFDSQSEKGSRFWFQIPVRVIDGYHTTPDNHVPEPEKPVNGHTPRLLVIDDNIVSQKLIGTILNSWDILFDLADSGQDALKKAQNTAYDLIVMDAHMPDMNGIEMTRAIRALNENISSIPIVALVANSKDDMTCFVADTGLNGTLKKPLELNKFADEIHRLTGYSPIHGGQKAQDAGPESASGSHSITSL